MEERGGTSGGGGRREGRLWSLGVLLTLCPANDPLFDLAHAQEGASEEALAPQGDQPRHAFEVALSHEAVWAGYRSPFRRAGGHFEVEALASDDDGYAGAVHVMRFTQPSELPLALGVGLGFYAGFVDEPDAEVYALTIGGAADYAFATEIPFRTGVEVSWAPDGTTFDDGEGLMDIRVRGELDLSSFAAAFVGYRWLEVDLDDESEDLDRGFHIGVRIGF